MGRTYRGLSKKDRLKLRESRTYRQNKRHLKEEEDNELNKSFDGRKKRDKKGGLGRDFSDDEYGDFCPQ